jgi:hypothetical protein
MIQNRRFLSAIHTTAVVLAVAAGIGLPAVSDARMNPKPKLHAVDTALARMNPKPKLHAADVALARMNPKPKLHGEASTFG